MAITREYQRNSAKPAVQDASANLASAEENGEKPVQIDGFHQVVEMLMAADPAFRESLLNRIARRDPRLAKSLREQIL
jgi:hypothetical protein